MSTKPKTRLYILSILVSLWMAMFTAVPALASPFGAGTFGADVPYGSATSLTINTSGNVSIQITPTDGGALGTALNTVTVSSTDVVGYKLYVRTLGSTDMVNGPFSLPASANGLPAALASNSWGYNTDGSSDFVGMTSTDVLIKTLAGPATSGDDTNVTYGVKVDNDKPAGSYSTTIVYTAVPQTD